MRYISKFTSLFTDTQFSQLYLSVSASFTVCVCVRACLTVGPCVCVFFIASWTCFYVFGSLSLKYAISLVSLVFTLMPNGLFLYVWLCNDV